MSKFFGALDESESSDSSEESEEELEDVKEETKKQKVTKTDRAIMSDSESDKEERKILTPEQKMREGLKKVLTGIDGHIKNKEFSNIHEIFNELAKELLKSKDMIKKKGPPNFLLSILVKLEDLIKSIQKSDEKNMEKNHKKNFGTLKNKFTKFIAKDFESALEEYRKNPVESEAEEEQSEGDDDEEDEDEKPKAKSGKAKGKCSPVIRVLI